jgi:hypothetical protein
MNEHAQLEWDEPAPADLMDHLIPRRLESPGETDMATKTITYKGETIIECERADWREHGGKWCVMFYIHGMSASDELCPHFQTIKAAKEAITEGAKQQTLYA